MKLTPLYEQAIIDTIQASPDESLILPAWAYGKDGRVVVRVDGLPVDLHRHLHEILIRPLAASERMVNRGEEGNVNPHLFEVTTSRRSQRTHCPNNHPYAGNEMPPNASRYRCRLCYEAARGTSQRTPPTHCPKNHQYTPENTLIGKDGKRRCRTCRRDYSREYMRNLRIAARKEKP